MSLIDFRNENYDKDRSIKSTMELLRVEEIVIKLKKYITIPQDSTYPTSFVIRSQFVAIRKRKHSPSKKVVSYSLGHTTSRIILT